MWAENVTKAKYCLVYELIESAKKNVKANEKKKNFQVDSSSLKDERKKGGGETMVRKQERQKGRTEGRNMRRNETMSEMGNVDVRRERRPAAVLIMLLFLLFFFGGGGG